MHFGCEDMGAKSLQWDQILYEVSFECFFYRKILKFDFLTPNHKLQRCVFSKHTLFHSFLI